MAKDIIKALEKLILPVSTGWEFTSIDIDDKKCEVNVTLTFTDSTYKHENTKILPICWIEYRD